MKNTSINTHRFLIVVMLFYVLGAVACNKEKENTNDTSTNSLSFLICGDLLVDERDGSQYPTVKIGNQCWMRRNLNIGTLVNSSFQGYQSVIEECQGDLQPDLLQNNNVIEKYCYDNMSNLCNSYGGLYTWQEVMNYDLTGNTQGLCPDGWHIPTDQEWGALEVALGMGLNAAYNEMGVRGHDEEIGILLKDFCYGNYPNCNSTNFSAKYSGYRNLEGNFLNGYDANTAAYSCFWTSTSYNECAAYARSIYASSDGTWRDLILKNSGLSCRCVMD